MHAFLFKSLPSKLQLNTIDILQLEPENSIGIEEVRQIQAFLKRKPLQSDHNQVIIKSAHLLTIPAQNALLKVLEEPPGDTKIYLETPYPDQLLPTIISRVQVDKSNTVTTKSPTDFTKISEFLSIKGVGERIKFLSKTITTRDQLSAFLDLFEIYLHQNISLVTSPTQIAEIIWQTRRYIKANVNLKLLNINLATNL